MSATQATRISGKWRWAATASVVALFGALLAYAWVGPERGDASPQRASSPEVAAAALARGTSDGQAAILADGEVSEEEYLQAKAAAGRCMEEAGNTHGVSVVVDTLPGEQGIQWTVDGGPAPSPNAPQTALDRAIAGCIAGHIGDLGQVRAAQNAPSETWLRERDARMSACLVDSGWSQFEGKLTIDVISEFGPLSDEYRGYTACHDSVHAAMADFRE